MTAQPRKGTIMEIKTPTATLEGDNIEEILEKYGRRCLRGADLRGADMCRANLRGANLLAADLTGADLTGADLAGANMTLAKLPDAERNTK